MGAILCAHPICGELHSQCCANQEVDMRMACYHLEIYVTYLHI